MKKPLRALFYGQTHEHAPGKLETLKKMRDEYEIVAKFLQKPPCVRSRALRSNATATSAIFQRIKIAPGGYASGVKFDKIKEQKFCLHTV